MRLALATAFAASLIVAFVNPANAGPTYSFTSFDPSGSTSTAAGGLNSAGQIAGYYGLGNAATSFVRSAAGTFTTFTIAGANSGTTASGINASGTVVGSYATTTTKDYGFVRTATGVVTTITDPNADTPSYTRAYGINNAGDVVGYYYHYVSGTIGDFGFLRNGTTGAFTDIIDPSGIGTFAQGVNNLGEVVGYYDDDTYDKIGFLRDANGIYTDIIDPNAAGETYAEGINDAGDIVGYYSGAGGVDVGFLRTPDGSYFDIKDPSATQGTMVTGIDDAGDIEGSYVSVVARKSSEHGFVAAALAVPEPGSLAIVAGALVPFVFFARRRPRT